ncbi:MAG TPA: hypothetical protein VNW15_05775, partial [Rhizomicrobium sp.]|nr:hypothetical protein [Rhizomicrobium sp.]
LDCVRLLSKFPRSEIVLNDGFHLSSFAHNIIGEAIGEVIVADFVGADHHHIGAATREASVRMPQKSCALPEKMEAGSRR